jgi:protein-tyrosine phosphatase
VTAERHLEWDGCYNVRDLGRIRAAGGAMIRSGAIVRSDSPDCLTADGWSKVRDYGIRTIVDLRNDHEVQPGAPPPPDGIVTVRAPLDDAGDTAFWEHVWANDLDGTPLYYRLFLERKPERCAAAIAAVARAGPGGVLIHCGLGRDRTGLITLLLLAVAGVEASDIASDYDLSQHRLPALWAKTGQQDQSQRIREILSRKNTSVREIILATLAEVDIPGLLLDGGLTAGDLAAVRARLLGSPGPR